MKSNVKRLPAILIVFFTLVLFAACGKGGDDGYNDPGGGNNNGGNNSNKSVSITGMAFNPATLTIAKGATVTWTNNENMDHTVTADDGSFDSGVIAYYGTYSKTFSAVGTFNYHCGLHSNMTGKIIVQ